MPVALIAVAAVSIAATAVSTYEQKKAADTAATTATTIAGYNASLDREQAQQVDLDTDQNIDNLRQDAAVYMSRQNSAYARNGIVANTGSALAVEAATAGKFAMREQQMYNDSQAKQQMLESEAQAGIYEGEAQAEEYHDQGTADVIAGAGKVASSLYGAYTGGAGASISSLFSAGAGAGVGTGTANLSSGFGGAGPQPM